MTILDAALRYRAEGLVVIPVHPRVKGPAIDDWQHEGPQSEERVRELFAGRDGANIGIVCGSASRLVVVDIDVKWGKAGAASVEAWEASHGALPTTRTHATPSTGLHLLYRLPEGRRVKSSRKVMGPDIDVQGERAQILAPPSVLLGESGSGGRPQVPGAYAVLLDAPIADCPAALLERLDAPAILTPSPSLEWAPVSPSDATFAERVALQRERFAVEPLHLEGEGAGNIRYVMMFQRLGPGLLLDAETTLRSYVDRYEPRLPEAHRWLPACRDELLHTIGRAYSAPMTSGYRPGQLWQEQLFFLELTGAARVSLPDAASTALGTLFGYLDLLGMRRDDGAREVDCLCGAQGLVSLRGRYRCSRTACELRTQKDVLRAVGQLARAKTA